MVGLRALLCLLKFCRGHISEVPLMSLQGNSSALAYWLFFLNTVCVRVLARAGECTTLGIVFHCSPPSARLFD